MRKLILKKKITSTKCVKSDEDFEFQLITYQEVLRRGSKILETRERVSVKGNPLTYKYIYLSGSRTSLEYLM